MKENTETSPSSKDEACKSTMSAEMFDSKVVLRKHIKIRIRFEFVGILLLMGIVWGLLTFPVIFYYRPVTVGQDGTNTSDYEELRNDTLECREDFFRDPELSNSCVPICAAWKQNKKAISITLDVVIGISYTTGFIAGIIIVVISVVRRKTMFSFPSSLVVYLTMVQIAERVCYIVTFFDRAKLFCSSKNLQVTYRNITPFCVVSGMIQVYSTLSIATWWLLLTVTLFWKVWFPFHAQQWEALHRVKYIHAACLIIGLFVPLLPIITQMSSFAVKVNSGLSNATFVSGGLGFIFGRNPPLPCNGNDKAVVFYTNILPADIMLGVGITLILLIFWQVHKQYTMRKASHPKHPSSGLSTTEKKLFILFCYYVISTVVELTAFSEIVSKSANFQFGLGQYFACERKGHDPLNPCDREKFEKFYSEVPVILAYGTRGLLPLFNIIFVINFGKFKEKYPWLFCAKILKKSFASSATPSKE